MDCSTFFILSNPWRVAWNQMLWRVYPGTRIIEKQKYRNVCCGRGFIPICLVRCQDKDQQFYKIKKSNFHAYLRFLKIIHSKQHWRQGRWWRCRQGSLFLCMQPVEPCRQHGRHKRRALPQVLPEVHRHILGQPGLRPGWRGRQSAQTKRRGWKVKRYWVNTVGITE
jgi:hypothetical protein